MNAIRKLLDGAESDWDLTVCGVQLGLNTRLASLHNSAPFSLFFFRSFADFRPATLPSIASVSTTPNGNWDEIILQMESVIFPAIRERCDATVAKMKERFDRSHKIVSFPVGSSVMAKDATRTGKLSPLFEGPFKVARRNRGGAYLLLDHDGVLLGRNFAPSQLIQIPSPSIAATVNPEDVHTVETIVNHRPRGRVYQYLVKWKGHDASHNTWEPVDHFYHFAV